MFQKALMITGLKKQQILLEELIERMESGGMAAMEDNAFYYGRTRLIAGNLRRLRRIRRTYGAYLHSQMKDCRHDCRSASEALIEQ